MTGTSCEVIDLQTLVPWDKQAVVDSVARTGRLVVVEEGPWTAGWSNDVAAHVSAELFGSLHAPVLRITCPDVPVPHSAELERRFLPSPEYVAEQTTQLIETGRPPATVVGPRGEVVSITETATAVERRAALQKSRLEQLARMVEIRRVEENVQTLYNDGHIRGSTHLANGQEAVSVGHRRRRPSDRRRHVHLSRPRHGVGPRRHARGRARRDLRSLDRLRRRRRRVDAPRRHVRRPAADVRHRRRRRPGRRRGGAHRVGPWHRRRGDRHLRRRLDEHRRLPRGPQPRRHPQAAGRVRVREQPLRRVHAGSTCRHRSSTSPTAPLLRDPRRDRRRSRRRRRRSTPSGRRSNERGPATGRRCWR